MVRVLGRWLGENCACEGGDRGTPGGTARVPRKVRTTYQEASTESDRGPRPEWTTSRSVVKGGARGLIWQQMKDRLEGSGL